MVRSSIYHNVFGWSFSFGSIPEDHNMTVLMGIRLDAGVLIASDRRRMELKRGRLTGAFEDTAKQVEPLTPTSIIATGGLAGLGDHLRGLAQYILMHMKEGTPDMMTQATLVQRLARFAVKQLRDLHPHNKVPVTIMLGGYDSFTYSSFFCQMSSAINDFEIQWLERSEWILWGSRDISRLASEFQALRSESPPDEHPTELISSLMNQVATWDDRVSPSAYCLLAGPDNVRELVLYTPRGEE
jgi:hypothetical protein